MNERNNVPRFPLAAKGEGRFFATENGSYRGTRYAFPHGCLLGLHLFLPRALGAREVYATLAPETGEGTIRLPLTLVRSEGGKEEYAALYDTVREGWGTGVFTLRLAVLTHAGLFHARASDGETVLFSKEEGEGQPLLLFREERRKVGGAAFLIPYGMLAHTGTLCRGKDGDYDRFFACLAAHGVHLLFIALPASGDARVCEEALSLPRELVACAEAHGIVCLCDLLPFVSLHKAGRLPAPNDPVGYRLCDDEPIPSEQIADPISPAALSGDGGVLERLLSGGYGGVFLRYADRFADSFLAVVRGELSSRREDALFYACTACGTHTDTPFGYRRRYFDGLLDGFLSHTLRSALLSYLSRGETGALGAYFDRYTASLATPHLHGSVEVLEEPSSATFAATLASLLPEEEGGQAPALARLGELIAATLPGLCLLPVPGEGEEQTLAFRLRLFGICRKEKAALSGDLRLHTLTPALLVFSRVVEGEMLLTVINRSSDVLSVSSPEGFSVLIGGRGRKLLYRLPPYSGTILRVGLFSGECGHLSFKRVRECPRDTRFAPRTATAEEKSS